MSYNDVDEKISKKKANQEYRRMFIRMEEKKRKKKRANRQI
jgi:hypothetical protein